jgi:hypothetical protein
LHAASAQIINLCSDEEDNIPMNVPKGEVEATPEVPISLWQGWPPAKASDDDDEEEEELYWPGQPRGVKRNVNALDSPKVGEDDGELKEVGGDAWKKASLSVTVSVMLSATS